LSKKTDHLSDEGLQSHRDGEYDDLLAHGSAIPQGVKYL